MSRPLLRLPLVEQTAAHLREGFQTGRWAGALPGVLQLADELMVSKQIVRSALLLLEQEGWVENCGVGRRRRIVERRSKGASGRPLRIGILLYEPLEGDDADTIKVLLSIRHAIEMAGHSCIVGKHSLAELNDNLTRISRLVKSADADAWIVFVASRIVLEWFSAQQVPVYAYGGRFHGLPIAASVSIAAPALESAVKQLVDGGHKRISMLIPTILRKPVPLPSFQKYLTLLTSYGIPASDYHLPHFDETPASLEHCLDSLFHVTPPTALLVGNSMYTTAVLSFLARRGLQVPRDVSVICLTTDPVFRLRLPSLACCENPTKEHIANITRWIAGVVNGRPNQRQASFDMVYLPGGTVGPAKR
ncbi:hypothetical protein llg_11060 [Luteolibacter sp. LG18]|nr:hypothetical protein llg_11060 [Luteolibacter sp. LG18]